MKLCIAFAMLSLVPMTVHADDSVEDFRIITVSGPVAVIPAGSDAPLAAAAGLPLSTGDRVVTGAGGAAELATKAGSVIRLDGNSSLGLDDLRSGWTTFRLAVGRFLGKFQHSATSHYAVKTPVAVASVRGTEFALDVANDGELNAGVVEGEVALESPTESEADAAPPAPWTEEVLTTAQGLSVRPLERPRRLSEIPGPLVASLDWFPKIRERIPRLRETWKDLDPLARQQLRVASLRERVQWAVPGRLRSRLPAPRNRVAPRPIERRHLRRPDPKRP